MARGQQLLEDAKTAWAKLGQSRDTVCFSLPDVCGNKSVDIYGEVGQALQSICKLLYPNAVIETKEDPSVTFEKLLRKGSKEDMTLFLGSVRGMSVSLSLSDTDADPATRTRQTPYKRDQHYPLSLQDSLRVVRSIMGPRLKRVSRNDCLRAIQVYGLLQIQYQRLSQQLQEQRNFMEELNLELYCLLKSLKDHSNQANSANLHVLLRCAVQTKESSPALDSCEHCIVQQAKHINELLSEECL